MDGMGSKASRAARALQNLQNDPDEVAEAHPPAAGEASGAPAQCPFAGGRVHLNVVGATHHTSPDTRALLAAIGGVDTLRKVTTAFYETMFQDAHLDQFVRSHDDPHAERLATWIAEKMGGGTPWSDERRRRPQHEVDIAHGMRVVVHDRSSAHFAAWHSPKRDAAVVGDHFNLRDARVWMRLMFWSARRVGAFDGEAGAAFNEWFVRFIGHFVRVYERQAPPFARESARWSLDEGNIQRYLEARSMKDVLTQSDREAVASLPPAERRGGWPYSAV